jgi:hypothetical protein
MSELATIPPPEIVEIIKASIYQDNPDPLVSMIGVGIINTLVPYFTPRFKGDTSEWNPVAQIHIKLNRYMPTSDNGKTYYYTLLYHAIIHCAYRVQNMLVDSGCTLVTNVTHLPDYVETITHANMVSDTKLIFMATPHVTDVLISNHDCFKATNSHLFSAAFRGAYEHAQVLITHGASATVKNTDGLYPAECCEYIPGNVVNGNMVYQSFDNHAKFIQVMLDNGYNPNTLNSQNQNALHRIISHTKYGSSFLILLPHITQINLKSSDGYTALSMITEKWENMLGEENISVTEPPRIPDSIDMVIGLLLYGANMSIKAQAQKATPFETITKFLQRWSEFSDIYGEYGAGVSTAISMCRDLSIISKSERVRNLDGLLKSMESGVDYTSTEIDRTITAEPIDINILRGEPTFAYMLDTAAWVDLGYKHVFTIV